MIINEVLNKCRNEKDIENVYRAVMSRIFKTDITSPYATDGVIKNDSIHCLLEFKLHTDLSSGFNRAKVLIQCLYYLKKYEIDGKAFPTTIFVGDANECFVISTAHLINNYLNKDLDWSVASSTAWMKYPELIIEMNNDSNLNAYVFDNQIETDDIKQKITDLSSGTVRLIPINSKNIVEIFRIFNEKVLVDKFDTQKTVALFIECLINHKDIYLHPKKKNLLVTSKYGDVKIKSDNYTTFFQHFKQEYSPSEARFVTEQKDRLVEETARRKSGEFFTPPIWVNEAHKELDKHFENWRERFIVWDNSCGTGNLTRDYKFNNLFMSTLNQEDVDIIKTMGYNKGANVFQFDFLNDDDDKIPVELLDSSKELLILMNPPYGTETSSGSYKEEGKRFKENTSKIKTIMSDKKFGKATNQLYCQFIYRLIMMKNKYNLNMKIGMFCPEGFMTKPMFDELRKLMYNNFEFKSGFIFEASEFADVEMKWPIAFTTWGNK